MTDISGNTAVIILAAGKGTRMKSNRAKVLHEINAVPMIHYVVKTALSVTPDNVFIVVGHQAAEVEATVSTYFRANFVLQKDQKGTGHAVQCVLPYLPEKIEHVVILCGDVPLLTSRTVNGLLTGHHRSHNDMTVLAVNVADPRGYGRIIVNELGQMEGIVEEADADDRQKEITLINTGIYCVKKAVLERVLVQIRANNAQNEFYLTDIIGIGHQRGLKLGVEVGEDPHEVSGINDSEGLARAEKTLRASLGETA
jgi:UDP-N-acetylglucosamine diphosphorylase/glucosamine-1-phosphate N-acetyltransferase